MYISRDDGKTWSAPMVVNDTFMDDRDAGLCAWGKGNILLSWFTNPIGLYDDYEKTQANLRPPLSMGMRQTWLELEAGAYQAGSFIRVSRDGGNSWSKAVQVPVSSPHGPTRRADGSLFYLGKALCWPGEEVKAGHIYGCESRDDGKTWTVLSEVKVPEGYSLDTIHEPHAVELPDGTLLGGLRITSDEIPQRNGIFTTRSADGGKTWSKPELLDLCGTPPHFLLHSSGAVILTYGRRKAPCGERARVSWDGGKTWGQEIVISQEAPDWDLGYPSSVELSDGAILTVYYQKYPGDSYNSILYTKWGLPEKE